jgi:hypothetical protein
MLMAGCLVVCACGGSAPGQAVRPVPFTVPYGASAKYHPDALRPAVAAGHPIGTLRCGGLRAARTSAHVELFAHGRAIVVPAGIGIAQPQRRDGAYIRSGRCSYPLRTREPTGLVEVRRGVPATLGDLFALMDQPLSRTRLGAFGGPVRAWLNGRRWRGPVRELPLPRHAQVVVVVGVRRVPVHAAYRFPAGR